MVRVLATGTFDILHPGHLTYFREAKKLGDELIVIVARDVNVTHKPKPIIPEEQRVEMVGALSIVDKVILGSKNDMFELLFEIEPDIITVGYDQHFRVDELRDALKSRGLEVDVVKIDKSYDCEFCSTSKIIKHILERYK
ncbi:MAG: adenylyltransferase/cytidyltransferase family protein [Halobacteriota archaeon]|nr:adenylyltransferase/cytidyltransferase family protein [Halobacteriota archaeon]